MEQEAGSAGLRAEQEARSAVHGAEQEAGSALLRAEQEAGSAGLGTEQEAGSAVLRTFVLSRAPAAADATGKGFLFFSRFALCKTVEWPKKGVTVYCSHSR